MSKITLMDYIDGHPYALEIVKSEIEVGDNTVSVNVYYEDIMFDGKRSRLMLFIDGYRLPTVISFRCSVEMDDLAKISYDMIDEYEGRVSNKVGTLTRALNYADSKEYSEEELVNIYLLEEVSFSETQNRWNNKYGFKSKIHREYIHKEIQESLSGYMNVNGDDDTYLNDLITFIKVHMN